MRSINKTIIVGNLTRDPDVRNTGAGEFVTTFGVATNRSWNANNSKHSSTEFHEVVCWSKLAEVCGKLLKKGALVYIEGYLKTRSFETKEGIKRYKTEVIAQNVIRLDKKDEGEDFIADENPEEISGREENSIAPGQSTPADEPVHSDNDMPADSIVGSISIDDELGL